MMILLVVVMVVVIVVVAAVMMLLLKARMLMDGVKQLDEMLSEHHAVADIVRATAPFPVDGLFVALCDRSDAALVAGAIAQVARATGGCDRVYDARSRNCMDETTFGLANRLRELTRQQLMIAGRVRTIPALVLELRATLSETIRGAQRNDLVGARRMTN